MSARVSCGPGIWNKQYNPLLKHFYTKHTKVLAFADDMAIVVGAESIGEAENFANIELNKIAE